MMIIATNLLAGALIMSLTAAFISLIIIMIKFGRKQRKLRAGGQPALEQA
jgi:hypothetical protein